MSQRDDIDNLITEQKRRLHQLRLQQARFGYNTPPHVLMEIEDLEKEIARLEKQRDHSQGTTGSRPESSEAATITPAPSFVDVKRKAMQARLRDLQEEYEAASAQWSRSLSEVDRMRTKRLMDSLEKEIISTEAELARAASAPVPSAQEQPTSTGSQDRPLRVFLSHASEDKDQVRQVYHKLVAQGVDAWLDEEKLLPGQDWQLGIRKAVRSSDVVLVFLSRKAVTKTGYVQKEIKQALDVADEQPEGAIFLIPVKLEPCDVPDRLRHVQWVNLYEEPGYARLIMTLQKKSELQQISVPTFELRSMSEVREALRMWFTRNELHDLARDAHIDLSARNFSNVSVLTDELLLEAEKQDRIDGLLQAMQDYVPYLLLSNVLLEKLLDAKPIPRFLRSAGFDIVSVPHSGDILAKPNTGDWNKWFSQGLYVCELQGSELSSSAVQSICDRAREYTDHALVVIDRQPELSAWMRIGELRAENAKRFYLLPIDDSLLKAGSTLGRERKTLYKYIEDKLGSNYDPFLKRDAVSDSLSFFGREGLLDDLADLLRTGERVGVFGIHKIGKSSVLKRLKTQLKFPTAYVYLGPSDTLNSVYNGILQEWKNFIGVQLPGLQWDPLLLTRSLSPSAEFRNHVLELLAKLENTSATTQLGIFLDEIDNWLVLGDHDQSLINYIDLMHTLRGLQHETDRLSLLVAGVYTDVSRVNMLANESKNPLFQVVHERFVQPFSRDDCRTMILSLGEQVQVSFDDPTIDAIYRASGGHPLLIRWICRLAWKLFSETGVIPLGVVEQVVAEFIRDPATNSYLEQTFVELTSQDAWGPDHGASNEFILEALARSPEGMTQVELSELWDWLNVESALYALTERSIIQKHTETGRFTFTIDVFRDWVRRTKVVKAQ